MVQCYNCKRFGHYSDKCPKKVVVCYKCRKEGHYSDKCPSNKVLSEKSLEKNNQGPHSPKWKNVPICYICGDKHFPSDCNVIITPITIPTLIGKLYNEN